MNTFSIIIPIYNSEKTIERCLNSCINQTYSHIEIWCIDDCSTDNSLKIVKSFVANDNRFKYISLPENLNLYMARKIGLEKAIGDYILFLDSDDFLFPCACNELDKAIALNHADIIHFGYKAESKKQITYQRKFMNKNDFLLAILSNEHFIDAAIWSRAYSNSLIKKTLPKLQNFRAFMAEDVYYSLVFYYFSQKVSYLHKPLVHYSDGGGSIFQTYNIEKYEQWLESYNIISKNIKDFLDSNIPEYSDLCNNLQIRFLKEFLLRMPLSVMSSKQKEKIFELINIYFPSKILFMYFSELQHKSKIYDEYLFFSGSTKKLIKKIVKLQIKVFSELKKLLIR
jgi:glycosyltransferase involved in cell wall biosynthesis